MKTKNIIAAVIIGGIAFQVTRLALLPKEVKDEKARRDESFFGSNGIPSIRETFNILSGGMIGS